MKQVTAHVAFAIFGDYDGNAPDTSTICLVASEELAKEVCEKLNENPRRHTIVCVDGWEHAKSFAFQTELVADESDAHTTLQAALAVLCENEDEDEDEDDDE